MDARSAARVLYMKGWTLKDIADMLGKNSETVRSWSRRDKWPDAREAEYAFQNTAVSKTQSLIAHQLKVLGRIKDKLAESLDEDLPVAELKKLLIDKGETDSLTKLLSTIKGKEIGWDAHVNMVNELVNYIADQDMELGKELHIHATEYLNQKRKQV